MLLVSAVLVGVGTGLDYPEFVQLGAAGIGAVTLAVGLVRRRPRVNVQVGLPEDAVLDGDAPQLAVSLTNPGRWRCFVTLLRVRLGDVPVTIELRAVDPGAYVEFAPRVPPLRRGVHPMSEGALQYHDPFGFGRMDHPVGTSGTLYVYPRTVVVAPMPAGGEDLDGRPLMNAMLRGGEAFYSLRGYVPGDSWRKIDWPSTARRSTLMVRDTTVQEETAHAVVIDTARWAYDDDDCFEQAVRVTASVCQATMRAGHALRLVAATRSVAVPAGDSRIYGPALDLLASVRLTDAGVDPRALRSIPPGVRLMVVTGRPPVEPVGWLSDLVRRHGSYVVHVVNSARQVVDTPAGTRVLIVSNLEDFRVLWRRRGT